MEATGFSASARPDLNHPYEHHTPAAKKFQIPAHHPAWAEGRLQEAAVNESKKRSPAWRTL